MELIFMLVEVRVNAYITDMKQRTPANAPLSAMEPVEETLAAKEKTRYTGADRNRPEVQAYMRRLSDVINSMDSHREGDENGNAAG